MDSYAQTAAIILMFAVVPVWLVAGLTDYVCHRWAHIERNAGPFESALHLLQLALVGIPVTLSLFFEVNAGLFAIWMACILAHHAVAYMDVRYANHARIVSPFEQMVHSFLEITPIMVFVLLAILFRPQLEALTGLNGETVRWAFELRHQPLPAAYIGAVLAAAAFLNVFPYLEEMFRTLRARRARAAGANPVL